MNVLYRNLHAAFLNIHFRQFRTVCRHMSENVTTTHLERTVANPRETVTAVGRIVHITQLSKTVMGIAIHVPNSEFKFKAGQWVDFMIPGVETVGGFSMKSSPRKLEKHRIIEFAVKKSDHPPAHWVHSECHVGDKVSLNVGGDFFYDSTSENSKELLFIAGGVGINPLYSILQEINGSLQDGQLNKDVKVELLYSASSLDELIFKDELEAMTKTTENIKCQMFVTQENSAVVNNGHSKDVMETDSRWQQDNETEDKLKTQSTTTKTIRAGKIENMGWDKNVLMEEVRGYGVDVVNWSELARKYQFWNKIRELGKNDGQIVQGYLKSHDSGRIRKRMKRSAVGETTVPCAVNNREWNNKLNKKILSGEYNIGELILHQQYEKAVLDQYCSIITDHFFYEGCKWLLLKIRERKLDELENTLGGIWTMSSKQCHTVLLLTDPIW